MVFGWGDMWMWLDSYRSATTLLALLLLLTTSRPAMPSEYLDKY